MRLEGALSGLPSPLAIARLLLLVLLASSTSVESRLDYGGRNSDVRPCWYGGLETFYKCFRMSHCPLVCTPSEMRRCQQIDIYEYFELLGPQFGRPVGYGARRRPRPFPSAWYQAF